MDDDKNINKKINFGFKPIDLPKARAGRPYRMLLGSNFLSSDYSAVSWVDGLEETGLQFFPEIKQITGVPRNSGSFDLHFNIREHNESEEITRTFKLIVEEDYDIPINEVDANAKYRKPDEDVHCFGKRRQQKSVEKGYGCCQSTWISASGKRKIP